MNTAHRILLLLLRLAIGWHLLFAGLAKFQADYRGSEGFLRESFGPLAPFYQQMAGDRLADEYAVQPLAADADPATTPLYPRLPQALADQWESYFERFAAHYGLSDAQKQQARGRLEQEMDGTVNWMLHGTKVVKKTAAVGPPIEVEMTTPERVLEYERLRDKVRAYQSGELSFGLRTPFAADKVRELAADKAAVARLRAGLEADLAARTAAMREALGDVLTPEQVARGTVPQPARPTWLRMGRLDWIDFLVRWCLVVAGAGLILGLLTRTSCLLGAGLLLSFYLAVPPLPGVPENLRVEGYPYVNKNIVEMLALLTLATTASGRWVGLDSLLYHLKLRQLLRQAPRTIAVPGAPEEIAGTPGPGRTPEPVPHASAIPTED
jgi:uncharacterized membrane protein YphA (DoxX/SURF4 family)